MDAEKREMRLKLSVVIGFLISILLIFIVLFSTIVTMYENSWWRLSAWEFIWPMFVISLQFSLMVLVPLHILKAQKKGPIEQFPSDQNSERSIIFGIVSLITHPYIQMIFSGILLGEPNIWMFYLGGALTPVMASISIYYGRMAPKHSSSQFGMTLSILTLIFTIIILSLHWYAILTFEAH